MYYTYWQTWFIIRNKYYKKDQNSEETSQKHFFIRSIHTCSMKTVSTVFIRIHTCRKHSLFLRKPLSDEMVHLRYTLKVRVSNVWSCFLNRIYKTPPSSPPEVFLWKGVLKIYSKSSGEHLCWSVISIKLFGSFIEIHTST